jgi:hypothetical protein
LTFKEPNFLIDKCLGAMIEELILTNLTSIIVKCFKEMQVCKKIMIFLFYEHLAVVMKKDLLIDLTLIIFKWLWEAKMFKGMLLFVIIYHIFPFFTMNIQRGKQSHLLHFI